MSKPTINLTVESGPKHGETLDRKPGSLIKIGRVIRGNTLAIKDPSISQTHLTIEFDPQIDRWVVNDLNTSNGTNVNGDRISASFHLSDGDRIMIGESTLICIKIRVEEGNVVGGRKGRGRGRGSGKKEIGGSEEKLGDSVRVLSESLDKVGIEGDMDLEKGRRSHRTVVLEKDENLERSKKDSEFEEVLDLRGSVKVVEPEIEVSKNLERGRRSRRSVVSKKCENLDLVVEDMRGRSKKGSDLEEVFNLGDSVKEPKVEVSKKLERGRTRQSMFLKEGSGIEVVEKLGRMWKGNGKIDLKESGALKNLVSRKNRELGGDSVKGVILKSVGDEGGEVKESLGRTRKRNAKRGMKNKEILDSVVEDGTENSECLGGGKKGKLAKVDEISDIVAEVEKEVPKNLRRGRSASSTGGLEKDVSSEVALDCSTVQPENLDRRQSKDVLSKTIEEGITDAPLNVRRGRKTKSARIATSDDVKGLAEKDIIQAKMNLGRGRRTRSTKVSERNDNLDSVIEDKIQVPNNVGRGKRAASTRVPKADESSVVEDKREPPKTLRRRKTRSDSSDFSNKDETMDVVVEKSIQIVKAVGRRKGGRAPSRITRTSSRALKEDTVLNPVENLHKAHKGNSCLLSQSVNTEHANSMCKKRQESEDKDNFDKENFLSVKYQKTSHVLPKTWNGNGIPNTTTKYKEDQKVTFHATPFEERLEKVLADDKLCPQRRHTG